MSILKQRLLRSRYKKEPEALQGVFLRWLNWVLKDSGWRAYIRKKLQENDLPVIDFTNRHGNHR